MKFWIDGDIVRFEFDNRSGIVTCNDAEGYWAMYQAWLAEGNEPEEWAPEEVSE